MDRDQLREYYNELNNPESYKNDYVMKYLVRYWEEQSRGRNLMNLISPHFADVHLVEGSLSKEKAVDMCVERSHHGAHDFTSTILAIGFMEKIAHYISKNIIELHGKQRGVFTNYLIPERGAMITVKYDAEKQKFLPTQYSDQVVVGIDREGLITHFHGDAQYATGDIFINTKNNLSKLDNK